MPTLANINGASLVARPDVQGLADVFAGAIDKQRQQEAAKAQQEGQARDLAVLTGQTPGIAPPEVNPQEGAIKQIGKILPEMAAQVGQALERGDLSELSGIRDVSMQGRDKASRLLQAKTHGERLNALREELQQGIADGSATQDDISRVIDLSNMPEDKLNLELQKMQVVGNAVEQAIPESLLATKQKMAAFANIAATNPQLAKTLLDAENARQAGIPEKPKGFTLSQGQTRFDASGREVASIDPKSDILSPEALAQKQQLASAGRTTVSVGGEALSVEDKIRLAAESKRAEKLAEVRAKGIAERESLDIASGTEASRAVPNIQRSIELLSSVQTGGIDAVKLKAKQFLGVESQDEAELVNALNQQVLAQLKPIFGAQFTKAEGDWLKAIEASESKSTEGNKRLLERGLVLARKRSDIGLKAAVEAKDFRSAQEIQDFIDVDLSPKDDLGSLSDEDLFN